MSSPKFMVFKLKDLKIPVLIFAVVIALLVVLFLKDKTTQTMAPMSLGNVHPDGKYISHISVNDLEFDLVVEIMNSEFESVSIEGLDSASTPFTESLTEGIDYVNTYVVTSQNTILPTNTSSTPTVDMLFDAIHIALSEEKDASMMTKYEKSVSNSDSNSVNGFTY